jgi:hypothetical protein
MAEAGLVPRFRFDDPIFQSLTSLTRAMDASRGDGRDMSEKLLHHLQSLILTHVSGFGTYDLVTDIEELMLCALHCGSLVEKHEIRLLKDASLANARRVKMNASKQLDNIIENAVLKKYPKLNRDGRIGKLSSRLTANNIASSLIAEINEAMKSEIPYFANKEFGVSAITKRISAMSKMDD